MAIQDFFQSLSEGLQSSAHVKTVYGEPIVIEGKTIVPVAKTSYGFGGGTGTRKSAKEKDGPDGMQEGGGGGGGVSTVPIGIVEITKEETRFIPFGLIPKLAGAIATGILVGYALGRRRSR